MSIFILFLSLVNNLTLKEKKDIFTGVEDGDNFPERALLVEQPQVLAGGAVLECHARDARVDVQLGLLQRQDLRGQQTL